MKRDLRSEHWREKISISEGSPRLDDCRCLACGGGALDCRGSDVRCDGCGEVYDVHEGVPCLVRYQPHEALSLIEILSNLDERRAAPTAGIYADWFSLLDAAWRGEDVERRLGPSGSAKRQFLPGRLRQYGILRRFLGDIDLTGKRVLDIGAGEGFDAHLLESLGADVTAAEFNPLFCALGRGATGARWIAASAHALPFRDESFDVVVAQAALHHILDVPAAMREALRVLRPDGLLLTISDSYRPDGADESVVLRRFDRDPAVLRGVNEGIPRFRDFAEALAPHADALDVTVHTWRVFGLLEGGRRVDLHESREWRWPDETARLADTSGGVSFRVRKTRALDIPAPTLPEAAIRPSAFLAPDRPKAESMAALARLMPRDRCDLPFPGPVGGSKFELLNGWMARREGEGFRRGYRRARRFVTMSDGCDAVEIEARSETRRMTLQALVDGAEVGTLALGPGLWRRTALPAATAAGCSAPISIELRIADPGGSFDDDVFHIRRLGPVSSSEAPRAPAAPAERGGTVVAVIAFRRPDTTRAVLEKVRRWRPSDVALIADGPRDASEAEACAETRRVFDEMVDWDCRVHREAANANLGLRRRVESGLDWLFQRFDRAVVLEDDCVPDDSFIDYSGALLERYADEPSVGLISGDNAHGHVPARSSYYLSRFALIWGWASWRRAWASYPDGRDFWPDARDSHFLYSLLDTRHAVNWWTTIFEKNYLDGNSWATVWLCANMLHGRVCAMPARNLVSNIGFGENATHTKGANPVRAAPPTGALALPLVHPETLAPDDEADRLIDKIMFSRDPHMLRGGPSATYDFIYADAMRRRLRAAGLSILAANHVVATFYRAQAAGAQLRRDHAAASVADAVDWRLARRGDLEGPARRLIDEIVEAAERLRAAPVELMV